MSDPNTFSDNQSFASTPRHDGLPPVTPDWVGQDQPDAMPGAWTAQELPLVQEKAERTWAAVERVRADAAPRESNAEVAADLAGMRRLYELQSKLALQNHLKAALKDVLAVACEFTGTDRGCVQLLSDDGQQLYMFVWQGYADESPFISFFRYEGFEAGCEVTRVQRQRLIIEETIGFVGLEGTDAGAAVYAEGIRAAQSTPMTSRSGVILGVLSTQFRAPHRSNEHELRLMDMLAWTAAEFIERHRADAALRQSEERLRRALSIETVGVLFFCLDGRIHDANTAFQRMCGYSIEELRTTAHWERLTAPEFIEPTMRRAQNLAERGETLPYEKQMIRPDGARWWGLFAPTRLSGSGRESECVEFIVDITEAKAMQTGLRASEEQFRRAIEDAPIPVIMHAENGQVLQISRTWTELTGYTREEIPTFEAWLTHAYGPGADEVRTHVYRLFEGKARRLDTEIEVRTRSGEMRCWAFSASAPGVLHDGRRFIVGMALDISERRAAENALHESQERMRLIVENAREYAIFSLDLERRVTSWNTGAQCIVGYPQEEAIGQRADIIFTAEDRAAGVPKREADQALAEGRATDDRWHLRKDGSRFWGSGVMMAMRDASGQAIGFVKIFRDQTKELLAKESLWDALQETERARAEAEAAGQAKDHFLAVLSHELRTPLTPVLMAVDILARDKNLSEKARDALGMIERNITLEAQLVDDLLDVTRITCGKVELEREPLDLHKVIRHAAEVATPDMEAKEQRLQVTLQAGEHWLEGDAKRLQQVFWNLLKNASKFSPERGEITITSRNVPGCIVVEVRDTGIGFEPEAGERIFAAFEQASQSITREFGGLGLGLAIAKATVDGHSGSIRAESTGAGHGATFIVELPLGDGNYGGLPPARTGGASM